MSALPRFGSALTALALASIVTGCASPFSKQGSASAAKPANSDVALATRAQVAVAAGDFAAAVDLAERAVENSPNDDGVRILLGNAYFGAGRFASAEAAYRDALALVPSHPQVFLKLALVQIAQGKNREALAFLNTVRGALDPADYGLALALAGNAGDAVRVLEPAARGVSADARVRQNLALAYGLAGDWVAARTIAAQDLTPDLVDARVRQWMVLAKPVRVSDQVAAVVGVTPAAVDPGQPVRLALRDRDERLARIVPQATPQSVAAPVETAHAAPVMTPAPMDFAPVETATGASVAEAAPAAPVFVSTPAPAVIAAPVLPKAAPPPPIVAALSPSIARAPKPAATAKTGGNAGVVVQLGAFSSASRVETAWEQISDRFDAVREYTPTSARFDSNAGPVYRLSVKGFATVREASELCSSLKKQGKPCFVRNVAGDKPVQFASR